MACLQQRASSYLQFEGKLAGGVEAIIGQLTVRVQLRACTRALALAWRMTVAPMPLILVPCVWWKQALPATRHSIETLDSHQLSDTVVNVLVTGKIVVRGLVNALDCSGSGVAPA